MTEYTTTEIRNVAFVGHAGSGKRLNRDAVLFDAHTTMENIAAAVTGNVGSFCKFKAGCGALEDLILKNLLNLPMTVLEHYKLVLRGVAQ